MSTIQQRVRTERKLRGLTQEEVASVLSISRASYIAIEQGRRELTMHEKQKLEELFGESVQGSINNQNKYQQMMLEFLSLPEFKEGVPKTKLAKLLYLADFGWFYHTLESMSRMQYRKIQFGPVPDYYFRAVDEMYGGDGVSGGGLIEIETETTRDGHTAFMISSTRAGEQKERDLLSREERDFIKQIAHKWKDAKAREIVAFTHDQLPYKICRENEIIPYSLITQEEPSKII